MNLHKMIEIYLKYDNMHIFGIINPFNCINNHVINVKIACYHSLPRSTPRLGGRMLEKSWSEPTMSMQFCARWPNREVNTRCIVAAWATNI